MSVFHQIPMFLAVDANKKPADLYIGYIAGDSWDLLIIVISHLTPQHRIMVGRIQQNRILIEQLQDLYMLLDVLKSDGGNYV